MIKWLFGMAYLIYLRQHAHLGSMQHSQRQAHHLQVLTPRRRTNVPRLRPHIKRDRFLQPWHEKVRALVDNLVADSAQAVEDHCAGAALDVVDAGAGEGEADGGGDGVAVDLVKGVRHYARRRGGRWRRGRWVGLVVVMCGMD